MSQRTATTHTHYSAERPPITSDRPRVCDNNAASVWYWDGPTCRTCDLPADAHDY